MLRLCLNRASTAVFIVFLSTASAAAAGDEPLYAELPNFHKVDEHLFRGAQPAPGGLARLKTLGVRTVLNLRHEPDRVKAEEEESRRLGLRYYSEPMHGLGKPTGEQVARVLALFRNPDNWPVFVHCKAGADRTGVMVALYRVAQAGWTAEKAIREALDFGMMKIEFEKRSYVRDYYAGLQRVVADRAAATAPPAPVP